MSIAAIPEPHGADLPTRELVSLINDRLRRIPDQVAAAAGAGTSTLSGIQWVTSSSTVQADADVKRISSTAATTLGAPQIGAGTAGQVLHLYNSGSFNITLTDGTGLTLATPAVILYPAAVISFVRVGLVWIQASHATKLDGIVFEVVTGGSGSGASVVASSTDLAITGPGTGPNRIVSISDIVKLAVAIIGGGSQHSTDQATVNGKLYVSGAIEMGDPGGTRTFLGAAQAGGVGAHTTTLAKITPGGSDGSLTWNADGAVTACTDPT